MYIAFTWLVGMSFVMWITMCFTDVYLKRNKQNFGPVLEDIKPFEFILKNATLPVERKFENFKEKMQYDGMAIFHGTIFIAGALAVTIFNRKSEIISYTKIKLLELNTRANIKRTLEYSHRSGIGMSIAIVKYLRDFWGITSKYMRNIKILFPKSKKSEMNQIIHYALLKKLKDIGEERRNLGQVLIAAIHENKNLRIQYQLEIMSKSRLVQNIEDANKQIKENRLRYVSFQQLYLVTHQENVFLKARVGKLIKEKDEAENNLMELMNEVYKSKNTEMKAFCGRFIVKTKNNLLNSDVCAEIQKFLQKAGDTKVCSSHWELSQHHGILVNDTNSWPRYTRTCETDILQEDSIVPLVSDAPKLKGLPGEYVWTVKDKNGIIEKLYEYDYESDYDNGDTIRRIRQYSVYYDRDCLLDFSNSKTVIHENFTTRRQQRNRFLKSQRFLTGSEAFQRFLKCNENIVASSSSESSTPRLFSG